MSKIKILVVDDDQIVLDSCSSILKAEGYIITIVTGATMAIEAMEKNNFNILLIDLKMPVRDGMDLMREVKEKWPEIPVIIMSGYSTLETMTVSTETGAAMFLTKPFTPDELVESVRQVIQKEERHGKNEGSGN